MEDLHWADDSSIELLESLYRLPQTCSLLFINVFRPGYPETGDRIVETLKQRPDTYCLEIALGPLNEKGSPRPSSTIC